MIKRISAITLKVSDMVRSVHFYNEILGLEVIYGGPHAFFTSLRRCVIGMCVRGRKWASWAWVAWATWE